MSVPRSAPDVASQHEPATRADQVQATAQRRSTLAPPPSDEVVGGPQVLVGQGPDTVLAQPFPQHPASDGGRDTGQRVDPQRGAVEVRAAAPGPRIPVGGVTGITGRINRGRSVW